MYNTGPSPKLIKQHRAYANDIKNISKVLVAHDMLYAQSVNAAHEEKPVEKIMDYNQNPVTSLVRVCLPFAALPCPPPLMTFSCARLNVVHKSYFLSSPLRGEVYVWQSLAQASPHIYIPAQVHLNSLLRPG